MCSDSEAYGLKKHRLTRSDCIAYIYILITLGKLDMFCVCSAAKAPFLARFKVRPCGINQLEAIAMQESVSPTSSHSQPPVPSMDPEKWQACIFKVLQGS